MKTRSFGRFGRIAASFGANSRWKMTATRVGVVEEVPQLVLDVAVVHVDRNRAQLERGEHPFEVLDRVVEVAARRGRRGRCPARRARSRAGSPARPPRRTSAGDRRTPAPRDRGPCRRRVPTGRRGCTPCATLSRRRDRGTRGSAVEANGGSISEGFQRCVDARRRLPGELRRAEWPVSPVLKRPSASAQSSASTRARTPRRYRESAPGGRLRPVPRSRANRCHRAGSPSAAGTAGGKNGTYTPAHGLPRQAHARGGSVRRSTTIDAVVAW